VGGGGGGGAEGRRGAAVRTDAAELARASGHVEPARGHVGAYKGGGGDGEGVEPVFVVVAAVFVAVPVPESDVVVRGGIVSADETRTSGAVVVDVDVVAVVVAVVVVVVVGRRTTSDAPFLDHTVDCPGLLLSAFDVKFRVSHHLAPLEIRRHGVE